MNARRHRSLLVAAALTLALPLLVAGPAGAAEEAETRRHRPRCLGLRATVIGTSGPDVLTGTDRRDVVVAYGGDDVIDTMEGNDVVCTGDGSNTVSTGSGNDTVFGGRDDDTIDLGPGRDLAFGLRGADIIDGGDDRDWIFGGRDDDDLDGGDGRDYTDGGRGDDNCVNSERRRRCEREDTGGTPAISIAKNEPGDDTAPAILAGDVALFTIEIENTGDTDLGEVTLSDAMSIDCEQPVADLAPGDTASITCGILTDGTMDAVVNEASVSATSPDGEVVSDSDTSTVPVLQPGISLTKRTNGVDIDVDAVPEITVGDPVSWTYVVENSGNGDLGDVVVDDPDLPTGVVLSCPDTELAEGALMTCSAEGLAEEGPYANTAIVTASNGFGVTADASDSSGYTGVVVAEQVTATGVVRLTDGAVLPGLPVTGGLVGEAPSDGITDDDGTYEVTSTGTLPGEFRVDVSTEIGGVPVSGTRIGYVPEGTTDVVLDPIELPNPASSQLFNLGGGEFGDFDEVRIIGLPPEVVDVYGEAFDQQTEPSAYPGRLGDAEGNAFNSTVFAWLVALDAAGEAVTEFASPVTVRVRVPANQHGDVFDLTPGNGVIDIPLYSFDEVSGEWVIEDTGIVTNSSGTPYLEADAAGIRAGSFGDFSVYAQWETDHFSWWNVDYKKTDFPGSGDPNFFDFGDVGGSYPTTLIENGVRHQDPNRLWLGQWADLEADADVPDADEFDDGLLSVNPVSVRINNWDITGSDTYLNILIDRNDDGDWVDDGEWAVQNQVTGVPAFRGMLVGTDVSWDPLTEGVMRVTVTDVPLADYDGTGLLELGETEDYMDPPDGNVDLFVQGDGAITSDVGGGDCPDVDCFFSVLGGTTTTLTAAPTGNQLFLGWGGDCYQRGTNPTCTVFVGPNDNVFVEAYFTEAVQRAFSLAPGSPTLTRNGWSPADIIVVDSDNPGTLTRLFTAAELGLDASDDINGITFGPPGRAPSVAQFESLAVEFSTTDGSVGAPGSIIESESGCADGNLGADIWGVTGYGGGQPAFAGIGEVAGIIPWFDEDGIDCVNPGPSAALSLELEPGDDVDAWTLLTSPNEPGRLRFTLAEGSFSLPTIPAGAADILIAPIAPGGTPAIDIPAADLGLQAGDDIDALAFDQVYSDTTVSISLTPGSPSLAVLGASPASVLSAYDYAFDQEGFSPLYESWFPHDLNLDPNDDMDALEAYVFGEGFDEV